MLKRIFLLKISINLLFLFSLFVCTGQLTMKTQAVFKKGHDSVYANRVICNYVYPGHYNEVEQIKADAELFFKDVVVNGVADRGRWDNFFDLNGLLPNNPSSSSSRYEPHYTRANRARTNTYPNEVYISERLHEAANVAFALSFFDMEYPMAGTNKNTAVLSRELALAVWSEIVAMAQDDKLDASNGGMERMSNEPRRINSSFGQTKRFDHRINVSQSNREGIQRGEPYYVSAMKIVKIIHSYGLIRSIIEEESVFIENEQFVNYWILDWTRWAYAQHNRNLNGHFGADWQSFEKKYPTSEAFKGTNVDQPYAFYNDQGEGINRIQDKQRYGLNNRDLIYPLLVKTYATYFDDESYEAWAYSVFRLYMALGIYPDGTHHELYRAGSNQISRDFPLLYPELAISILVAWARTHEIGVLNGSLSNPDKYWNYNSSLGSDELYLNAWETSTSGGKKGIEMVLESIAGYLKPSSEGGFVGDRYNQNGVLINNQSRSVTSFYAMANQHLDNDLFQKIIDRNGYPPYKKTGLSGLPSEAGAAWGLYLAMGGETAILPYSNETNSGCQNLDFQDHETQDHGTEGIPDDNENQDSEDPGSNTSDGNSGDESENQDSEETGSNTGDGNSGDESENQDSEETGSNSDNNITENNSSPNKDTIYGQETEYVRIEENPVKNSVLKIVKTDDKCVYLNIYGFNSKLLLSDSRCAKRINVDLSFLTTNAMYILQIIGMDYRKSFKIIL